MTEDSIGRVVVYARQSSGADDPADSISLDAQVARLRELAESKHWVVVGEARDGNISGRTFPDTPEARSLAENDSVFQAEVASKPEGKRFRSGLATVLALLDTIDAVLVWDSTRLMRPVTSSFLEPFLAQKFIQTGTLLYTPATGVFDFRDFQNMLVSAIDNRVQDNALQVNKQKTAAGRKRLRDEGMLWNSSVVNSYGYRPAGKQCVEIVHDEADVVRRVFRWFVEDGMAIQGIAKRLNAENVPTKTRKKPRKDKRHLTSIWRSDSVRNILRRHQYAGFDSDSEGRKVEIVPLRGKALIGEEMYYRAKAILEGHERFGSYQTRVIHPLTGLLYCGYCGGRMHRGDHGTYGCHDNLCYKAASDATTAGCRRTRIKESTSAFFHGWRYTGLLEGFQPLLTWALAEQQGQDSEALEGRLVEVQAKFSEIEQREREVGEQVAAAELPSAQVVNVLEPLKRRREELNIELQHLEEERAEALVAKPISELAPVIRRIAGGGLLDRALYRDLARRVFRRIDVFAEKVTITFTDGSDFELPRVQIGNSRTLPLPVTLLGSEWKAGAAAGTPIHMVRDHHAAIVYLQRTSQIRAGAAWLPTPPDRNEILYDNGKLLVELSP
jgi:hypothetical protein